MRKSTLVPTGEKAAWAAPLTSLQKAMNLVFEDFEQNFGLAPAAFRWGSEGAFSPELDVLEEDDKIVVRAELPGIDEHDIDVSVQNSSLTLRGEKRTDREEKGKGYYRCERHFGAFSRTVPLPCPIQQDQVSAQFKQGVLTIDLPKTPESRSASRSIPINAK